MFKKMMKSKMPVKIEEIDEGSDYDEEENDSM